MTPTHQEVTLLLPWYVNGTLNEQEMAAVEDHLESCADCRDAVTVEVREASWLNTDRGEARVAALTGRSGQGFQALKLKLGRRDAPRSSAPSRTVTTVAALLVIGLALPAAWLARPPAPVVYELKTDRLAVETPVLQLVFRDGTSAEDIELLLRASGTPLGRPTAHGIYRIALVTDDPQALLTRIRSHPAVRWAEIEL